MIYSMVLDSLETQLLIDIQEEPKEKPERMIQMMLIHLREGVMLDQEGATTHEKIDNNMGNNILRIPPFLGHNDPDAYMEWEINMQLVFECQNYTKEKKVKFAATEFSEYTFNWWEQIMHKRRHTRIAPVNSWYKMKTLMKTRFVPSHYGRDLHKTLRRVTQGTKSVEDYFQEMETLMIKAFSEA